MLIYQWHPARLFISEQRPACETRPLSVARGARTCFDFCVRSRELARGRLWARSARPLCERGFVRASWRRSFAFQAAESADA